MNERTATLLLLALLLAPLEGAAQPADPAAPRDAAELEPTTPPPPKSLEVVRDTSGKALSMDRAVRQALAVNPNYELALLDVKSARAQLAAEEGRYPYIFAADAGVTYSRSPRLGAGDTVTTTTTRSITAGTALRRTFPNGTTAEVRAEGEHVKTESPSLASSISPTFSGSNYATSVRASVVQPLLRGAGTDVGELELRAARLGRESAEKGRQLVQSSLVRDVISAYWELWFAERSVEIDRASLALAKEQEREARERAARGGAAPADSLTFETRSAQLEEAVVASELERRRRSLALSILMGSLDENPERYRATSDLPEPGPAASPTAVASAMRSGSVELAELEQNIKLARVRADVAGDAQRPRLDLEGYVQSTGISERFPKAVERTGSLSWWSAHAGLSFEIPLDDTRKNAERTRALLAVKSAEAQLRGARQRVASEATLAVATDNAARRRLSTARRTLAVAERAFEAESARYELGAGLPIQVMQAEEDLRTARLRLARARVDAVLADVSLRHLTGRLLADYTRR